jgi:hypothetical protein
LQVPHDPPQPSSPQALAPQSQVLQAPEMQLWPLAQQAAPQPWPAGQVH